MTSEARTLIDTLLEEQRSLAPLERFSRRHANGSLPAQAKYYRDLIPLTTPPPGHQYAFEVDLDKCSGCKACVSACHSLNGLDEGETWREVGILSSDDWRHPFQQTITTACHHCADPACLNGCPVLAYDKDKVTGIVRHLDDQCIGCQYCVMKCPYDVPKYSARRGIVRKCDMCANRLAVNEAPACAQACPSEAIRISIVPQSSLAAPKSDEGGSSSSSSSSSSSNPAFLPCSPDSSYTQPTTVYKSSKPLPASLLPGDHGQLSPSPAHLPLVLMLVLMQLSAGATCASVFLRSAHSLSIAAATAGIVGIVIASLHLGKPLKAWRAFLGWRTSWFSREVIAFGAYVPLTILLVANEAGALKIFAALLGLVGVSCSALLYADTRREFWSLRQSLGKFFGSTALLGSAVYVALTQSFASSSIALVCLIASTVAKLGLENRIFDHLVDEQAPRLTALNKSALLLAGQLGLLARARVACGVLGGIVFPWLLLVNPLSPGHAVVASLGLVLCLGGELLERYLFFTAVAPAKMPGSLPG